MPGRTRRSRNQGPRLRLQPRRHQLAAPHDVRELPGFAEGRVSVQDEAAQLTAEQLEKRARPACPRRLLCAWRQDLPPAGNPAGTGRSGRRRPRGEPPGKGPGKPPAARPASQPGRRRRQGHRGVVGRQAVPAHPPRAPCSATGVIRRHPDIKLARKPEDIAALAHLQGELLDALWPTPGSRWRTALRHLFGDAGGKQRQHRRLPRPHARRPRTGPSRPLGHETAPRPPVAAAGGGATMASTMPS